MSRICISIVILLSAFSVCFGQSYWEGSENIADGVRQPLIIHKPKEEAAILKSRWAALGEEIKSTPNLAAGTYAKSGYRGYYLRFAPNNEFVIIYHYEDIDIIDYSYGKVEISDYKITFLPEKEMAQPHKTNRDWVLFGRTLVGKKDVRNYADYLAGLGKFNDWNCDCQAFFTKTSYNASPKYLIPKAYKHFFRPPIIGKITFAGTPRLVRREDNVPEIETRVELNIGKLQGVKRGLRFRFYVGKDILREIVIKEVRRTSATGLIMDAIVEEEKTGPVATYYDLETKSEKPMPKTRVGLKVTTEIFPALE